MSARHPRLGTRLAQAGLKVVLRPKVVAAAIKMPLANWPGQCHAVATRMIEAGLVPGGRVERGLWIGPVAAGSLFAGHPFSGHSWVRTRDDLVLDPTRYVFEDRRPYIFVGELNLDEYDPGGNRVQATFRAPYPAWDPNQPVMQLALDGEASLCLAMATGLSPDDYMASPNRNQRFTQNQLFWLANLSPDELGEYALAFYQEIVRAGNWIWIPGDNWDRVTENGTLLAPPRRKGDR